MALFSSFNACYTGAGNQLLTLPAGVLATRMQAQARLRMDVKDPMQQQQIPTSMLSVARLIYAEGGLFNFWKVRSPLAGALICHVPLKLLRTLATSPYIT